MVEGKAKISVVIPLMPIEPYKTQIKRTLRDLSEQTARPEVVVSEMPIEKWCNKGRLFNSGYRKTTGDIIFFCDADIIFKDKTLLERMRDKLESGWDVIYPLFYSPLRKVTKIADGHPFMWRSVKDEYGDWDETMLGISLQEFLPLYWFLKNKRFYCGPEFKIDVNTKPFIKGVGKVHRPTRKKCREVHDKCVKILQGMGAWPQ